VGAVFNTETYELDGMATFNTSGGVVVDSTLVVEEI